MIVAAALPLLAWVALFHVADAAQTIAAFVLRAYRIATVPLVIYALALWGIGLGGGYAARVRPRRRRAGLAARRAGLLGRWRRSACSTAALGLCALLAALLRAQARGHAAPA